jgi:hypothetical protein
VSASVDHWPIPPKQTPKSIYDIVITHAAAKGVLIPAWVPRRLLAEYADAALEYGEELAAQHIRKVRRELSL